MYAYVVVGYAPLNKDCSFLMNDLLRTNMLEEANTVRTCTEKGTGSQDKDPFFISQSGWCVGDDRESNRTNEILGERTLTHH